PGDRVRLEEMQARGDAHNRRRAQVVLLAADGIANTEIAARVGVSRQSVVTWRGRYAASGLQGLRDRSRSGRPSRLAPIVVVRATFAPPTGRAGWTSRTLADHLGVSGSPVSRVWSKYGLEPMADGVRLRAEPSLEITDAYLVGLWISGSVGVAAVLTEPPAGRSTDAGPPPAARADSSLSTLLARPVGPDHGARQ